MCQPKRLEVISKNASATTKISKWTNSFGFLPAELQLGIVRYLPRTSLPAICRLNKHWRIVGTEELLRRLFPNPPHKMEKIGFFPCATYAIAGIIETNNVDALQRLLTFRPKHPYFRRPTTSLLLAEPASLRARVTKDEEERFCLEPINGLGYHVVNAAFKYNDMSCMRLLIDHALASYRTLLGNAVYDSCCAVHLPLGIYARPTPGLDSRGGHNSVLNWLLAYPPRHVVQAMLIMWGRLNLDPRLLPLCDWCDLESREDSSSCDNMLIVVAGRGHPASLQAIGELRMMVEILTDDASGGVIPEARWPLSEALCIARGMASMWPGTPPLVAEYLQSVCTWEYHPSCSCADGTCDLAPHSLYPKDPVLHKLIDLKTYDEMLEPFNWQKLQHSGRIRNVLTWLASTEFLSDEEAARRMRCFKWWLRKLSPDVRFIHDLLYGACVFRRWRCVEVVLGELPRTWPGDFKSFESPDVLVCCAILDAVRGEPGCADGRIIRKMLRAGPRNLGDSKGVRVHEDIPDDGPFLCGWFGWEPFRVAFVERQQDREQRETAACMEMRDAVLDFLSISDQKALNFLVDEPSKALYRASARRRLRRWADKRESGKGTGRGSSFGASSRVSATTSSNSKSSGYPS